MVRGPLPGMEAWHPAAGRVETDPLLRLGQSRPVRNDGVDAPGTITSEVVNSLRELRPSVVNSLRELATFLLGPVVDTEPSWSAERASACCSLSWLRGGCSAGPRCRPLLPKVPWNSGAPSRSP